MENRQVRLWEFFLLIHDGDGALHRAQLVHGDRRHVQPVPMVRVPRPTNDGIVIARRIVVVVVVVVVVVLAVVVVAISGQRMCL